MATKKTTKNNSWSKLLKFSKKQTMIIVFIVVFFGGAGSYFLTRSNAASCTDYVLRYGSSGYCVGYAQRWLNVIQCHPITVDGLYGPQTTAAVKNFQYVYNKRIGYYALVVDGVVGPKTWYALNRAAPNMIRYESCYPEYINY